jgi:hypothetical protein
MKTVGDAVMTIFEVAIAVAFVEVFRSQLGRLRDKINYKLYRISIALRRV